MLRVHAKYGFGDAPLKLAHREKTESAIRVVLSAIENLPRSPTELHLDAISHVKGQFTRTVKQDQWDWSTVWRLLGRPSRGFADGISKNLGALRVALKNQDFPAAEIAVDAVLSKNILRYLHSFLNPVDQDVEDMRDGTDNGHIYILSTRMLPTILKIGVTQRSVEIRVKEINRATGVIVPFGVRAVWEVKKAKDAEKEIHLLFDEYRVREDREFFEINFENASKLINDYLRRR